MAISLNFKLKILLIPYHSSSQNGVESNENFVEIGNVTIFTKIFKGHVFYLHYNDKSLITMENRIIF